MQVRCPNLIFLTLCSIANAHEYSRGPVSDVTRTFLRQRGLQGTKARWMQTSEDKKLPFVLTIRGGESHSEETPEEPISSTIDRDEKDINTLDRGPIKEEIVQEDFANISVEEEEEDEYSQVTETETEYDYDGEGIDREDETEEKGVPASGQASIDVEVIIKSDHSDIAANDNDLQRQKIELLQNRALELRTRGKGLHDSGDFTTAADTFHQAAKELETAVANLNDNQDGTSQTKETLELLVQLAEERATCRLHEALCHLKNKNYSQSIVSCTDVLLDGVQVVPLDGSEVDSYDEYDDTEAEEEEGENDKDRKSTSQPKTAVVRISPNGGGGVTAMKKSPELSAAVRARAYHRRAKARLALEDTAGALEDSRSAAFLGDRNAVALYGRLMRESGGSSAGGLGTGNPFGVGNSENPMGSLFGSSSASPFSSMFSGGSPFSSEDNESGSSPSFDILSSLLKNSGSGDSGAPAMPFGALGGLGSMLGANAMGGKGGAGGLAKSVLSSVSKRAEDKSTQEQICKYLNGLDSSQLISLSGMAGSPLSQGAADRIVSFAHGVTPKGIRKVVKWSKRILLVGSIMTKTLKIFGKYKHLLVLLLLVGWTKSAISRPVVVKKAAKKTAEAISKAAFI